MYALSFDMVVSDLKQYYGEPYNKAYYEIKIFVERQRLYVGSGRYIPDGKR